MNIIDEMMLCRDSFDTAKKTARKIAEDLSDRISRIQTELITDVYSSDTEDFRSFVFSGFSSLNDRVRSILSELTNKSSFDYASFKQEFKSVEKDFEKLNEFRNKNRKTD